MTVLDYCFDHNSASYWPKARCLAAILLMSLIKRTILSFLFNTRNISYLYRSFVISMISQLCGQPLLRATEFLHMSFLCFINKHEII